MSASRLPLWWFVAPEDLYLYPAHLFVRREMVRMIRGDSHERGWRGHVGIHRVVYEFRA